MRMLRVAPWAALLLLAPALSGCFAQPSDGLFGPVAAGDGTGVAVGTQGALSLRAAPARGAAPLEVTFTLSMQGDGQEWTLDFGDRSTPSTGKELPATVKHTYDTPGSYTAKFKPSGGDALAATVAILIIAPGATLPPEPEQPSPTEEPAGPPPPEYASPARPPSQSSSSGPTSEPTSSTTTTGSDNSTGTPTNSTSETSTSTPPPDNGTSETTTSTGQDTNSTSTSETMTSSESSASSSSSESTGPSESPTPSDSPTPSESPPPSDSPSDSSSSSSSSDPSEPPM